MCDTHWFFHINGRVRVGRGWMILSSAVWSVHQNVRTAILISTLSVILSGGQWRVFRRESLIVLCPYCIDPFLEVKVCWFALFPWSTGSCLFWIGPDVFDWNPNAFQSIFLYHDLVIVHFFVGHVWTNESDVDSIILWRSTDDSPHPLPYPFLLWHSLTLLFRVSFFLDATNLSCLQVARRSWIDSRRLHTFKMTTGQTCQQIQFKLGPSWTSTSRNDPQIVTDEPQIQEIVVSQPFFVKTLSGVTLW